MKHPIIIIGVGLLVVWLLAGCSTMTYRGSVSYSGQYGDYSLSSDGKTITTDIKLKSGYAK